jgi:IS5 family transposase
LLLDAISKVIELTSAACSRSGIPGWRQSNHNFKKIRKLFHKARKTYRSKAKSEAKREKRDQMIREAHLAYIDVVDSFLSRAKESFHILLGTAQISERKAEEIGRYIHHAERQIDQIQRRVIHGETIAHDEKVFSIFEEHTEWIVKGKAGISQELGLRVCILEDQYGFILHHLVMEKQEDKDVAVPITLGAKQRFPNLRSCSYDKGFYTPSNRGMLRQILAQVTLPKKGRVAQKEKEIEYSEEFVRNRRQHSAIESAINALENHGLDRCLDRGIIGFERYVAMAVVARNIHILGHMIQQQQKKKMKRAA